MALGWNIFRAGGYGANILTFDCAANRDLGLSQENCLWYRSGLRDLDALADEITEIVRKIREEESVARRRAVRALFHSRHRYLDRWTLMYREIHQALSSQGDLCEARDAAIG